MSKKTTHVHRSKTTTISGFGACVAPDRCNPAAHGNIMETARCRCGAIRETLINGNHVERSEWAEEHSPE